jgi:regulator of protease activity HflC (stomatin/prohibitin superfamily)
MISTLRAAVVAAGPPPAFPPDPCGALSPASSSLQPEPASTMEVAIVLAIIAIIFVFQTIKIVPQQSALVVERLGRFDRILTPGLKFVIPFIERVAYRHSLKEVPLDVPSQVCITRDNTQLQVDGILYFQVTDPKLASYGSSDYLMAITQLAQTTLRSVIGRMELDKTFEERDLINASVVSSLDEAAMTWGVKVLRYEIKDLTPPNEILRSMQAQITAEREKRALIAASEGRRQEQINIATGEREAFIARSEGEKQAEINKAQGEAEAIRAVAAATADAIRVVAESIQQPGGEQAVQLKVAEKAVEAYGQLAQRNNTMIVPGNMSEVSALIGTAMTLMKGSAAPR